jgi:hypothetical protein
MYLLASSCKLGMSACIMFQAHLHHPAASWIMHRASPIILDRAPAHLHHLGLSCHPESKRLGSPVCVQLGPAQVKEPRSATAAWPVMLAWLCLVFPERAMCGLL